MSDEQLGIASLVANEDGTAGATAYIEAANVLGCVVAVASLVSVGIAVVFGGGAGGCVVVAASAAKSFAVVVPDLLKSHGFSDGVLVGQCARFILSR